MTKRTPPSPESGREGVLIEIVTIGNVSKISAIDTATGTEVSVMGPAHANRTSLETAAFKKLEFMLKKRGKQI